MRILFLFALLYLAIGFVLAVNSAPMTCDPKTVPDVAGPIIDPCAQVTRTITLKQILLAPLEYLGSYLSSLTSSIGTK